MWHLISALGGFFLGIIVTWAIERRRYEVLVREARVVNAAIVEVMEGIADALVKIAQASGGNKRDG